MRLFSWSGIVIIPLLVCSSISSPSYKGRVKINSPSCDSYAPRLSKALDSVKVLAKDAYRYAIYLEPGIFSGFFRSRDQELVRLIFKNMVRTLNGHGPLINVWCNSTEQCLGLSPVYYHRRDTEDGSDSDYMNFCPKFWEMDGNTTRDYCEQYVWQNRTLTYIVMIQLLKSHFISNGTDIHDLAFPLVECMNAAVGILEHFGSLIPPIKNLNNFVHYAEIVQTLKHADTPGKCPPKKTNDDSAELRHLLSADDDQTCASLQLLNGTDSSSSTSTNTTIDPWRISAGLVDFLTENSGIRGNESTRTTTPSTITTNNSFCDLPPLPSIPVEIQGSSNDSIEADGP